MTFEVMYQFTRAPGHLGSNRASTDALALLHAWETGNQQRSYEVLHDEDSQLRVDDVLVARLRTTQQDVDANRGLMDDLCSRLGLVREVVKG
jgi:hypothetical protein